MIGLPGGNGASIAGDWDLDGTDIPPDDLGSEPAGSCDDCGANIYAENTDTGLCDQCEWARSPRGTTPASGER